MVCVKWLVMVMMVVVVGGAKQYCTYQANKDDEPNKPDMALQYTMKTESVESPMTADHQTVALVSYEEWVYDAPKNRIVVKTSSKIINQLHRLDWDTQQMLILSATKEGNFEDCVVRPVNQSISLFTVIFVTGQEVSSDQIPDPGVPLGILNWTDTQYKGTFTRRDIMSHRWEWCGLTELEAELNSTMVSMATYWSDPGWEMPVPTDNAPSVPLGFEVIRWGEDIDDYFVPVRSNIVYYEPDVIDELAFLIPPDVHCPGMIPREGHPFPDLSQENFFSFSFEYRENDAKTVSWADAWYDFEKKLYRVDHDATPPTGSDLTTSSSTSNIVTTRLLMDYNDGVAFEFVPGTLTECRISLVNGTREDWSDLTGLNHLWGDSPSSLFGSDVVNYTYYGPGMDRFMVMDDWRALRTDWPPGSSLLWRWSFTNKNVSTMTNFGDTLFVEKQVPIGLRVSAQRTVNTTEGTIHRGDVFLYSIYDFEVSPVGKSVEFDGVRVFDAYDCYSANWRDDLRFKLDVSSWPEVVEKPLLTSTALNEYWQVTVAMHGKVSPIRITRVQTIVEDAGEVWVKFVLLYRHSKIGNLDSGLFHNMTTGSQARGNLTLAINNDEIKYEGQKPNNEKFVLMAIRGSLTTVVEPECTTTTSTTTTTPYNPNTKTTTTTPSHHKTTTTTPANHETTTATTSTTTDGGPHDNQILYSPGDLAGLGIGMVLMGFALGAGGTFLVVVKGVHNTIMGWCSKG